MLDLFKFLKVAMETIFFVQNIVLIFFELNKNRPRSFQHVFIKNRLEIRTFVWILSIFNASSLYPMRELLNLRTNV